MPISLKHFLLQGAILVCWLVVVILPMADKSVEAQITCPNIKYLGPIPGFSWYKDTEVTVKIDSNWNPSERSAIANGNGKWNDFNCSGVEFVDFGEKTYTLSEYNNHPPNGFVYWQRIDPVNGGFAGGVFHKLDLQNRTIAARIKIHPNLQNTESGTHYIWLGAHEIGHTFNLDDCLCANQCSCQGQVSVMSGHGTASLVRIFMGRDGNGKRKYLNKTVRGTKKAADTYLSKTLTEISAGTFVESSPTTVQEYLDKWLETAAKPRLRDNTYKEYAGLIERYVKPSLGAMRLSEMRPLEIQKFYVGLTEKELSPRTVRFTHSVLTSAFKQAVRWRLLAHNPCDSVELPRKASAEMQSLTPAEAARFLKEAESDRWSALFVLALATGLRPSEYLGLKWSDIDLERGVINVQRSLHWRSYKAGDWYFADPKTPRSRRRIPLPASVLRALVEHRRHQAEQRLKAGPDYKNLDLVFATSEGQPLIRLNVVQKHFKPTLQRAELPSTLRLYDLRHSCATLLLAANENPKVVSERLGHASITLTMDTYSHVMPDMQQGASDKLEQMLFTKTGTQ